MSPARDLHITDKEVRVKIIDAGFDRPVLRNGTIEMASTGSIIQSPGFLKLDTCGLVRCQVR